MVEKRGDLKSDWKSSGRLYEGEDPDIHREVLRVLGNEDGSQWLREPNVRFAGKAPEEIIKAGEEYWIRDVLRSHLYVGSS